MSDIVDSQEQSIRKAVLWVAVLNLSYFVIEFTVGRIIQSVSLVADSIDFLEDASVNFLILLALKWNRSSRAKVGILMSFLLLVPAIASIWTAIEKFTHPTPPNPTLLSLTALGALLINSFCALWLSRYRRKESSLIKAAYLSARNDALANISIIGAGLTTAFVWNSIYPDLIVGIAIAALNASAAYEVWKQAQKESQ